MKPIKTNQTNVIFGKDNKDYEPLPAWTNSQGQVVTCWQLTDEEVQQIIESKKIYLMQLTFNQPLQPVSLHSENPVLDFVPHKQTRLQSKDQDGNCYATVIACLMGAKSPEDVIQIQEHYNSDNLWLGTLKTWLKDKGWQYEQISGHLNNDEPYLVIGESPRDKNVHHICIYKNSKMVHDPHPDNTGIKNTLEFIQIKKIQE